MSVVFGCHSYFTLTICRTNDQVVLKFSGQKSFTAENPMKMIGTFDRLSLYDREKKDSIFKKEANLTFPFAESISRRLRLTPINPARAIQSN